MLYSKMSSKAWGEYSLWFYGSAEALPDHEIDMIESVLVGVITKVWINCIPEFQWKFPNPIAPAVNPNKPKAWRQNYWGSILEMNACCRRNPQFGDKVIKVCDTPAAITVPRNEAALQAWVAASEPHTLFTEVRHFWQKLADAVAPSLAS